MSERFDYHYSAELQAEVDAIRRKYLSAEGQESKLEQLRRLDASVSTPGTIASLTLGIAGTLVFGLGICCVLVWRLWLPGVLLGVIGFAGVLCAYPLYRRITAKRKEKLAPEILRLAEELSQN